MSEITDRELVDAMMNNGWAKLMDQSNAEVKVSDLCDRLIQRSQEVNYLAFRLFKAMGYLVVDGVIRDCPTVEDIMASRGTVSEFDLNTIRIEAKENSGDYFGW